MILKKHHIPASFFFTGNFYSNPEFETLIKNLKKDGHYLGPHSDKHLLYADWIKRDSLLVDSQEFKKDLLANFDKMKKFGIKKQDVPYYIPPYEWYNKTTVLWAKKQGLQTFNFSPGTQSNADYTYPAMGKSYRSSEEIYQSIIQYEATAGHGLNGFILLIHIGTDPRRTDKFYNKLDQLLKELEHKNYSFLRINDLLK
ncbi:: hypothetical protein [Arcticibacter svalbardensis MN12-7]|uniref:NodB homology domain-containing protein n=1 Tax=Arcticibacter svalbardensis MN12-7 TaxID=1150600 RepID=R9H691_9SPHI|nr:polysaccharide deacetylase family protein [Arcticibacter svalbardensis]EOR96649.1 : hypothetical protein [Arcticibacter svalbardensis MN12-7]